MVWILLAVVAASLGAFSRRLGRQYRHGAPRPSPYDLVLHQWLFMQYVLLPLAVVMLIVGILDVLS